MAVGRPRAFDIDEALDEALRLFWRKGYEGVSVADLTREMKINPPSLYAAFGNKEQLFRKALDRYSEKITACMGEALEAPTARESVERLLRRTADRLADPQTPNGCLMVQGALMCGEASDPIRQELTLRRSTSEAAVRHRLERARDEGDLPAGVDPAALARYILIVTEGMSVHAASGASRAALHEVVDLAMRNWPTP
ncbi:TetR/AcrR family transcriptional regulator [Ancylobacter terrae]|uniref:TetR/AcrR family transcriptional regulator n=1 Tax=Ancylobacter sp. sgz301288 TaxID=3342077 RepID=UPI00385CD0C3